MADDEWEEDVDPEPGDLVMEMVDGEWVYYEVPESDERPPVKKQPE